jgi:putative hydrolases of HD superfamily
MFAIAPDADQQANQQLDQQLDQQLAFLLEIDKLKQIQRQNFLADGSRHENSAEHSWHLAMMALTLQEYSDEAINIARVVELLLVHDLVEIGAGDTFLYDQAANFDKKAREVAAADQLFARLPIVQAEHMRQRWDEFEAQATAEARFALALDAFGPMLQNYAAGGGSWRAKGISGAQVLARKRPDLEKYPRLWLRAQALVAQTVAAGFIAP